MNNIKNYKWKVVPLCEEQLKDVRNEDILDNGNMRKCNTYRGGGGYDQFPNILKKRLNIELENYEQLIIQLYGCNLSCPYCYVTKNGIFNKYIEYETNNLIKILNQNNLNIFHLMGGAPAIYIDYWNLIIDNLDNKIFHSDLLLSESEYKIDTLNKINKLNCLYAVNIKGTDEKNYFENTLTKYNEKLIFKNFENLLKTNVNFYITFTAPNFDTIKKYKEKLITNFGKDILNDSFVINLIKYKALNK